VTSTELGVFATLIATSAVVIVLILTGVPRLARLLFRQRLETIRDDLVDAVLDGRLPREASLQSFIKSLDQVGDQARLLTLPRAIAMYLALVKLRVPNATLGPVDSFGSLESDERRLMHEFEKRRQSALWSYLTWGSPLGWAMAPLLVAITRHIHPVGKLADAEEALPRLTDEAVLYGGDETSSPGAVGWIRGARHLIAPQR
jgi:hypothetical protein